MRQSTRDALTALLAGAGLAAMILATACTPQQQAQLATAGATLQAACTDAIAIANIAGLVPGVGAIVPYITAGCATAEGIARLAADPSSTQWLGELVGKIKALAAAVGLRLP